MWFPCLMTDGHMYVCVCGWSAKGISEADRRPGPHLRHLQGTTSKKQAGRLAAGGVLMSGGGGGRQVELTMEDVQLIVNALVYDRRIEEMKTILRPGARAALQQVRQIIMIIMLMGGEEPTS